MIEHNLRTTIGTILLILAGTGLFAQSGVFSPYSRFGIGDLGNSPGSVQLKAMGGISNSIVSNRFVNSSNPATYSGFDSLSFLFGAAFKGSTVTYNTTTQSEKGANASLNYFNIGFPVTRYWKSSISLLPYSQIDYNVVVLDNDSENNINYNMALTGSGGLSQLMFGNAFKLTKNLSVGFNAAYVFGKNSMNTLLYFPDSIYIFNTKIESRTLAKDFLFEYGILYQMDLGNKTFMNIGLTYGQQIDLNIKRDYLVKSINGGVDGGVEYLLDTIQYDPQKSGTLVIPPKYGLGLSVGNENRWLVGMDFNWQNWETFKTFGEADSLINSWNVAMGGQFTPKHTSISKYWKRVTYRVGARYDQTYLKIKGEPINEFGISFGLGLPLPRSLTTIDFSMEVGRRGTTASGLIKETFVNFTAGISIYERWFVKRRYN